ncbi:hypothetical protein FB451DRAFT_1173522 [Mycena latifolia]|nr:hypothetical protein FB451DRAFT_1173522 [Mycena latifolia]
MQNTANIRVGNIEAQPNTAKFGPREMVIVHYALQRLLQWLRRTAKVKLLKSRHCLQQNPTLLAKCPAESATGSFKIKPQRWQRWPGLNHFGLNRVVKCEFECIAKNGQEMNTKSACRYEDEARGGESTPSECCSQREYACPQAALLSLNWTKWMGRTDGERIEGNWAEAKQAGGMTKEMNAGHRHDTLNDFFNDWNWIKVQNLERYEHFHGLCILRGRELVDKWWKESTEPYQKGSEWHSAYRLKEQKAPSQATILKEMIASEQRAEDRAQASATTPVALYINVGLKLQARQRALRTTQNPTSEDDQTQDSVVEKQRLGADIKKWHQQQQHICPQVLPSVVSEPYKSPEWERLFLPSDFTSSERTKLGLETLGAEELKLRQGEANDALRSLREHIQHSQALRQHKNARNNAVHGQAKNTRAVQKIKDVQTRIQNYVKKYRHARTAMIALGCNPQDPKFGFPELRDEDLYTKIGSRICLGLAHHCIAARVQWHHAHADMERWQEEVEILGQEFRRAIQGFNKMEATWTALAHDHENEPGKKVYALKVADAQEQFKKVGGTWPKAGVSLAQHIKSERPDPKIDWAAVIAEDS